MPHRLLACTPADDARAYPMAMSFSFSDSLPSTDWSPPDATLLYEPTPLQVRAPALELPSLCSAWAETEHLGL